MVRLKEGYKFMFLKPFCLLIFLTCILSTSMHAQDSLKNTGYMSEKIKINPIQSLINELGLSYEHRFSQSMGIEINGGYIYSRSTKVSTPTFLSSIFISNGFFTRLGVKYYYDKKKSECYFETLLIYKYSSYNHLDFPTAKYTSSNPEFYNQTQYLNSAEIAMVLGWEYNYDKSPLDVYIGVGLRNDFGEIIYFSHNLPAASLFSSPIIPEKHEPFDQIFPTIKLGLKIGIGFNKV